MVAVNAGHSVYLKHDEMVSVCSACLRYVWAPFSLNNHTSLPVSAHINPTLLPCFIWTGQSTPVPFQSSSCFFVLLRTRLAMPIRIMMNPPTVMTSPSAPVNTTNMGLYIFETWFFSKPPTIKIPKPITAIRPGCTCLLMSLPYSLMSLALTSLSS